MMGAEARRPSVAASPPRENAGLEDNLDFALTSEARRQEIVEAEYLLLRALVRTLMDYDMLIRQDARQ